MADQERREALNIAYTPGPDADPDLRCTLEAPDGGTNNPSPADLAEMLARARAGQSARQYQREACAAAEIDEQGLVTVHLGVHVWPSHPDLRYTLRLPDEARGGRAVLYSRQRQWKLWADGAGVLLLPWRLEDATLSWYPGLPCMDGRCNPVTPAPALGHEHARVFVNAAVYGLIVARGTARGYYHPFGIDLGKIDDQGNVRRIDLDAVSVSVTWTDAAGETREAEIDVPIPACAKALLALCPDGRAVYRRVTKKYKERGWEIAYNACDGRVLGKRRVGLGGNDNA